jgi:hypothetical protein
MTPVVILGPYAASTPIVQAQHLARVAALSAHAVRLGLAPWSIHHAAHAGAYGDDAVPVERERGLAASAALIARMARAGAQAWVIGTGPAGDDGVVPLSPGTRRDLSAYLDGGGRAAVVGSWGYWKALIDQGRAP